MKKLIAILLFSTMSELIPAQEQFVKPNLSGVKVFLKGAELIHTAKIKIEKGITNIVFTDVARNIEQNSLNVSAKGDFVIMSVSQRLNYLGDASSNPALKNLQDSLEIMSEKLTGKQNEIDGVNAEIDLIYANKNFSGDKAVTIAELQKMGEFFRKRIGQLKSQVSLLIREHKIINKEIERLNKQLAELNSKLNQPLNEVVVTVSSKTNTNGDFTLSYLTYDAGWKPVYDIRVKDLKNPSELNYKANVNQNTGLDWNDINIVLSTRNPVQNNNKPELNPWFIDFLRPVVFKSQKSEMMRGVAAVPMAMDNFEAQAENMAEYMEVNQSQLSIEFVPTLKYSIPSDAKPHAVALQSYSLPAKYEYYAAPKLDNNAFLVAHLSNWNDYNLMPGTANVYYENSYVGQSYINPFESKDTLTISLGRDQGIVVSKNQLKDYSEDKFLSGDIERFFAFDIVVKNNKNIPINILVEEQIPISQQEDIEVKLIESSSGKYSEKNGFVEWNMQIEGSKSINKKFVYSVRYPKDKVIPNL